MAAEKADFTRGKLLMPILKMAFPIFLTSLLQTLYNAADVAVVGQFVGDVATASVGATSMLTNLLLNLVFGISTAVVIMCANFVGKKDYNAFQLTMHTSISLSLILGIIVGLFGIIFSKPLLVLLSTPQGPVLDGACIYMRIYFAGAPFAVLYNFAVGILRSVGETKKPLYILVISGFVNLGLNVFLVTAFSLGVAGVAIATVVSQIVSVFLLFRLLIKSDGWTHFDFKKLSFDIPTVKELLRMGIPAGLNGMTYTISNLVIQKQINALGQVVMTANTVETNIGKVQEAWNAAITATAMAVTSQNMGANKYSRIKTAFRECLKVYIIGVEGFAAIVLLPWVYPLVLGIFTKSSEVIAIAYIKLILNCGFYFLISWSVISTSVLRGMGVANGPTILNYACICLPRIVWILTIYQIFYGNVWMLYMCYPVSWIISSVAAYSYMKYKQKKMFDAAIDVPDGV